MRNTNKLFLILCTEATKALPLGRSVLDSLISYVIIFYLRISKYSYRIFFNKRPRRLLNFETVTCGAY